MSSVNSKHLMLNFTESDCQKAWIQAQSYTNEISQWNAYLNILCLSVLKEYFQYLDANISIPELSSLWEFINGCVINLGNNRLIIIPQEELDTEEFSISQEWVDLPNLAGNYYLAVQILPDEGYLKIWGLTSHNEVKNNAEYDVMDRSYNLNRYSLTEEVNVLWALNELDIFPIKFQQELLSFSEDKVNSLINLLSKSDVDLPRLEIDFIEWGVLLNHSIYRDRLYNKRLAKAKIVNVNVENMFNTINLTDCQQDFDSHNFSTSLQNKYSQLTNWLTSKVEQGWQTIDELLTVNNSYAFRHNNFTSYQKSQDIKKLVEQIYSDNENLQKQAAKNLGEVKNPSSEIIQALNYLINHTTNVESLWTAAESLWQIAPHYQGGAVRRIKDLGLQINGNSIALMVAIIPKSEAEIAILLRVYPLGDKLRLPLNLQLIVLDEQEKVFLEAKARDIDNYIQLKFSGQPGERFAVKLALNNASLIENFLI